MKKNLRTTPPPVAVPKEPAFVDRATVEHQLRPIAGALAGGLSVWEAAHKAADALFSDNRQASSEYFAALQAATGDGRSERRSMEYYNRLESADWAREHRLLLAAFHLGEIVATRSDKDLRDILPLLCALPPAEVQCVATVMRACVEARLRREGGGR